MMLKLIIRVTVGMLMLNQVQVMAEKNATQKPWHGVHVQMSGKRAAAATIDIVDDLAQLGVNVLVVEINYGYEYKSHPELRSAEPAGAAQIKELLARCRKHGIRLIPQFQCLGHQSWDSRTNPLLTKYPQFDETPGCYPNNEGIYCRSWCPLHPEVNKIVFDLMDELIEVFEADALHVGMDEIFLIGEDVCPRCRGRDKAELFARAVNDYHKHLAGSHKIEMLMWGDRLIDSSKYSYGEYEASAIGTAAAIDLIPKDIIICDWHYELRRKYESVPMFLEKGFRLWPASWRNTQAAIALIEYSQNYDNPRMLGHLNTVWSAASTKHLGAYAPLRHTARIFGGASAEYWQANPLAEPQVADLMTAMLETLDNLGDPPTGGRVLDSKGAKEVFESLTGSARQWTVKLLQPHEKDSYLLGMGFAGLTESKPGDAVQGRLTLNSSGYSGKGRLRLEMFIADDLQNTGPWVEYRYFQLLAGDRVIWETDLSKSYNSRGQWIGINLPDEATKAKDVELSWRVVDKRGVSNYPTIVFIGPVRLVEAGGE